MSDEPAVWVEIEPGESSCRQSQESITEELHLIVKTAYKDTTEPPLSGSTEDEISNKETELGVRLPQALRELYRTVGNNSQLLDADYHIFPLAKLRIQDRHLIFCDENQGTVSWAIEIERIQQPNPRVRGKACDGNKWLTESSKLSGFLINLVCWQAIMVQPEIARDRVPEEDLEGLENSLGFIGKEEIRSGAFRVSFTGRKESLLATYLYNTVYFYFGALKPEILESFEARSRLQFEWL